MAMAQKTKLRYSIFILLAGSHSLLVRSLQLYHRRRDFLKVSSFQASSLCVVVNNYIPPSNALDGAKSYQNFKYSDNWVGTALPRISLEEAARGTSNDFNMGRWPDPILRVTANRIDNNLMGSESLRSVANKLRRTARINQAVGLAAQQCGVDGSLIFLDDLTVNKMYKKAGKFVGKDIDYGGLFLCNPRIIQRSPEVDMTVWTEECLVLPPTFTAATLRDSSVTVQYEDLEGITKIKTLNGELARALQHEMDHDRGILILDHVDLESLESETMKEIEKDNHGKRMLLAYSRYIDAPSTVIAQKHFFVESASAMEVSDDRSTQSKSTKDDQGAECDDECKAKRQKIIEERRAMMRQSKSSTSRRETMELSRQRAALYNTQYKGL